MGGASRDCVSIGRGAGWGLAECGVGPACEFREFSGRPAGSHEATEGLTLLDCVEVGADLLEVRGAKALVRVGT